MTLRRPGPRTAAALGALSLAAFLATIPLGALAHELTFVNLFPLWQLLPFAAIGALVARRQPQNSIGWIMLAIGLIPTLGSDAGLYAVHAYRVEHHGLPLSRVAVSLAIGWLALVLLLPLPILLFPTGRIPARWRSTLYIYVLLAMTIVTSIGIADAQAFTERTVKVDSSGELMQFGGTSPSPPALVQLALVVAFVTISLAWILRQVAVYRRATGEQRAQVKWLLSGGAICVTGLVVSVLLGSPRSAVLKVISDAGYTSVIALPISLGIGILRYRLYEIDKLISRTLSYAIVTGLLVSTFIGLVVLITDVLPFSSPVGVAAATLAAAALFNPLRRRVQRVVDRRFNRARYDHEATVDAFARRLRDAIELDAVQAGLLDVVNRAVEPAHLTVWIRSTS